MLLDKIKGMLDLSVIKNIVLEDLAIDFTKTEGWTTTVSSDNMFANLTHIPGFTWPIKKVQIRVILMDNGKDLGELKSPYQPASVSRGVVSSSISSTQLSVFDQSKPAFLGFVASLATNDFHTFKIKGTVDIIFSLGILGSHNINGVDFLTDLTLRGLNSLPDITCRDIIAIPPNDAIPGNELILRAKLNILNPSQLNLTLGDFALSITPKEPGTETETSDKSIADRRHIGVITIENLTLTIGVNNEKAATINLKTDLEEAKQFLKRLEQEPQTVLLRGFHGTSKNEALSSGLVTMETTFVIPKITINVSSAPEV